MNNMLRFEGCHPGSTRTSNLSMHMPTAYKSILCTYAAK